MFSQAYKICLQYGLKIRYVPCFSTCSRISACTFRVHVYLRKNINYETPRRSYCDEYNVDLKSSCYEKSQEELNLILKDPKQQETMDKLKLQIEHWSEDGFNIPVKISPKEWITLLFETSKSVQRKYLGFLWLNEMKHQNDLIKKEEKLKEVDFTPQKIVHGALTYGLQHNNMFLRIYDTTINNLYNWKLFSAMIYEPIIVIDCGYEDYMNTREKNNAAKQITLTFAKNRFHNNPVNLYLCNADKSSYLMKQLQFSIPTIYNEEFPLNVTSKSYLDIFNKSKLVYLTPHCKNNLTHYDSDAIYIIGGIVDKTRPLPFSLAKAKKEGVRMARLPLEQYLDWGIGASKNLTIEQTFKILLDLRETKDWNIALKNIPRRKLKEYSVAKLKTEISDNNENAKAAFDFSYENRRKCGY